MHKVDIAIVGGGMVGLTLASQLADSPFSVALISQQPLQSPVPDTPQLRVSAINEANRTMLEHAGAWQRMPAERVSPYQQMTVWDQDSFGQIDFSCADTQTPQLGHIIENQVLTNALAQQVESQSNVSGVQAGILKVLAGEHETMLMLDNDDVVACKLLVGADGANSFVRKQAAFPITFRDYGQSAIVATVRSDAPHNRVARQVFTPDGPLALLPLSDPHLCSIVWSQTTQVANALYNLSDDAFSHALTAACGSVLGVSALASERQMFGLTMRYARQWTKDGLVIIGDAAHTIHPLAGQGANLGMQDAVALAEHLHALHQQGKSIARYRYLRPFERARKTEAMKMVAAMDGFKTLFNGNNPLKKMIRGAGLLATDNLPSVKRQFISQAMGF